VQSFESSQLSHYTPNYVYENFDMPMVIFFFFFWVQYEEKGGARCLGAIWIFDFLNS